ncbi:hypothetical protein AUP68_10945 [Ilyonectria robusta]
MDRQAHLVDDSIGITSLAIVGSVFAVSVILFTLRIYVRVIPIISSMVPTILPRVHFCCLWIGSSQRLCIPGEQHFDTALSLRNRNRGLMGFCSGKNLHRIPPFDALYMPYWCQSHHLEHDCTSSRSSDCYRSFDTAPMPPHPGNMGTCPRCTMSEYQSHAGWWLSLHSHHLARAAGASSLNEKKGYTSRVKMIGMRKLEDLVLAARQKASEPEKENRTRSRANPKNQCLRPVQM